MKCFAVGLTILLLTASASLGGPIVPRVTVSDFPDAVVVYVHDLDLLRAGPRALSAEVQLAGVPTTYRIDLGAGYQTPALLIRKAQPKPCGKISVVIRGDDNVILRQEVDAGPLVEAVPRLSTTGVNAFIEPGRHMRQAPTILQPDLDKLSLLSLTDAQRVVELDSIVAKVESDINYPLVSANNNCAISRQTAHPGDPSRRSCYVPLKSQLYDPKTGKPARVVHYLAEIPLDPEWLKGTEDTTIMLPPDGIKIHTTARRWPPENPKGSFITGEGSGGLGQLVGSVAVDDDGNIYYSASMPCHVVRFNIAKGEFEAPPIDIIAAMNAHLPKKEELPEELRDKGARWDTYIYVATGGGRLFVSPVRYAVYGQVYLNGVFSFPLADWYDAAKFRAGMRFVAGCWPGSPAALYNEWPKANAAAFKVAPGFYHDSKYYMTSYGNTPGGPWCIELNPDGSPKRVSIVRAADMARARQEAAPALRQGAGGVINWWDYGVLTTTRAQLSQTLTGKRDDKAIGTLTIMYDAIAAMRLAPQRYADILSNLKGPSLAPCYMAVGIPDKPGHILAVGEYGYYLADIDLTVAANGVVPKKYLQLDTGKTPSQLPVKVGLGPYGHLWWQEGNKRYLIMVGYTGIARMLYSVDGKPLDRHDSVLLRMTERSLDGAPSAGFKWHQYPVAGIDGRVYLGGTHQVDRGGHPYSTGLMAFSFAEPKEALRLAHMSRASNTTRLRTRVLYEPDGHKRQEFVLAGGMSINAYILQMEDKDLPENRDAKLFFYACDEGSEPKDLFGFSLPVIDGKSGVTCQVFSRDRRYLVTLQHGCILTFDMANWRYVDGYRLSGEPWRFERPHFCFQVAPDDRIFLGLHAKDAPTATFYEVDISPAGLISLRPHLTLKAGAVNLLQSLSGGVVAFVADPRGDGSYDLCLGPAARVPGTELWVVPDFLPPRTR